jgi:CBS domain-containing protein
MFTLLWYSTPDVKNNRRTKGDYPESLNYAIGDRFELRMEPANTGRQATRETYVVGWYETGSARRRHYHSALYGSSRNCCYLASGRTVLEMVSRLTGETISSITSTRVPTCQPEDSPAAVREALVGQTWESASTIYVLDGQTLVGRVDIVDLLRSADDTLVSELMESADARLHPDTDREHAIFLAITEDRDEIPIVDADGRLVGAVTSQAIIDTMHREHIEDTLRRAGVQNPTIGS